MPTLPSRRGIISVPEANQGNVVADISCINTYICVLIGRPKKSYPPSVFVLYVCSLKFIFKFTHSKIHFVGYSSVSFNKCLV